MFLQVILNLPLDQSFTYSWKENPDSEKASKENKPQVGSRSEIMFGNKRTTGIIIQMSEEFPKDCQVEISKIKPVKKILDEKPILPKELLETALWVSKYYLCSFGEAAFSMIPSGRRESGAGGFSFEEEVGSESHAVTLSQEQKNAVDRISEAAENSDKATFHYLYGPTGSGKTEVFLSVAEKVLASGKSVIYLVPEIGLTAQVTQSISKRFGNTAAILHSGLTPSRKLAEWHRIQEKEARVIVGARSAVFAPCPDLGLIIIDEEHDGSYKSGNTPRYHARQVAMHRCQTLKIPLLMGSATPSVEAWQGMKTKTIACHFLTKRLAGGTMPHIACINLRQFRSTGCISKPLEDEINKTLAEKKQIILFLNRRGFTHFFSCTSCGYELVCKNCSVPMTYHKSENRLKCHYCGWSVFPPSSCPQCGSVEIGSSGFGTEFIENETRAKFPQARILRLDTDTVTQKETLIENLDEFKKGNYDILLGTQMVAKGLNFPNLKLVGVISADTGLHMPDFRAGERTFSLITQVAGRAGRYFPDGKVMVQTYNPENMAVSCAVYGKISEFYETELQTRNLISFPPFSRLVRLVFRSPIQGMAYKSATDAAQILKENAPKGAEIIGPAECPILKLSQNFRYQILLKGASVIPLQNMARNLQQNYTHPQNVFIEYDVDPISLL